MPAVPLAALLLLTFPVGRLPARGGRLAAWTVVVGATASLVSFALYPGPLPIAPTLANPLGVEGVGPALQAVASVGQTAAILVLLGAIARLVL